MLSASLNKTFLSLSLFHAGLDPAEPNFVIWGADKRLDKTDATFVDVIHSDGEPFVGIKGGNI